MTASNVFAKPASFNQLNASPFAANPVAAPFSNAMPFTSNYAGGTTSPFAGQAKTSTSPFSNTASSPFNVGVSKGSGQPRFVATQVMTCCSLSLAFVGC